MRAMTLPTRLPTQSPKAARNRPPAQASAHIRAGGQPPDIDPGKATRAKPDPSDARPRATQEVLIEYAHRMLRETGRLSRDLLEHTVREDGYSVASDKAGEVVRTIKAALKAAHTDHSL
jgi:hypothetical protein